MVTKSQAYPSKFFKGEDVATPIVREITDCNVEPMENPEGVTSDKLVISFANERKRLVCNATNFDNISSLTGEADSDNWVGHRICLFANMETVRGKRMACVRVRAPTAPAKKATPQPKAPTPTDDDNGGAIPDAELERMQREADERGKDDDVEF
jgi:hypothetical protein